jgi:hypothetical protein
MANWGELNIARGQNAINARKAASDTTLQSQKQLQDILQYLNEQKTLKGMQNQKLQHEAGMETLQFEGGYGAGAQQFNEAQPPGFIEGFLKTLGLNKNENALYTQPDLYQGGTPAPLAQQLPNITKPKEVLGTRTKSNLIINEQEADIAAHAKPKELKAFEEMGYNPDLTFGQKEKLFEWAPRNYLDQYNQKNETDFEGKEYIQGILGQDQAFATKYMKIDPLDPNGRWILDQEKIGTDKASKDKFVTEAVAIVNNASNVSTGVKRGLVALGKTPEEWMANIARIIRGWTEGEVAPVAATAGMEISIDTNREKVYQGITTNISDLKKQAESENDMKRKGLLNHQVRLFEKLKGLVNTHPDQMNTVLGQNSIAGLTGQILNNPKDNAKMVSAFKTIFGIDLDELYSDIAAEKKEQLNQYLPWYYQKGKK